MKRNKLLAFVLSLCLTVGLVPTLTANAEVRKDTKVKVESKQKKDINQGTETTTINIGGLITPINPQALEERKNLGTEGVKKCLKWAIEHMPAIIKDVEKEYGSTAANFLRKYAGGICDVLEPLMEYEDVTFQLIRDTVYNYLYDYIGSYPASLVADAVKYAIIYLSPV